MKLITYAHWKDVVEVIVVKDHINKDSYQKKSQTDRLVTRNDGKNSEQNDDRKTSQCNNVQIDNCAIELGI